MFSSNQERIDDFLAGGGGDGLIYKKNLRDFIDLFFLGRPNRFSELSQFTIRNLFRPNFLRRKIKKKTDQRRRFRHFLENFDLKVALFSARASPSKLVHIGLKGAFRKNLGSATQKWLF